MYCHCLLITEINYISTKINEVFYQIKPLRSGTCRLRSKEKCVRVRHALNSDHECSILSGLEHGWLIKVSDCSVPNICVLCSLYSTNKL